MVDVERCIISVRIIGVMHRDEPKVKVFMASVLWSESEVIIYRSFQEFKKFHRQLKKRFPPLNLLLRSNRLIPKFRARAMKSSLQQKGSSRSVVRMRFLEDYCSELLSCDVIVTQNSLVIQFFTPKDDDLKPDLTKNSIMILPSNVGGGVGEVSHPLVTQTYRCVAPYETQDTKNRPFKVALDEKLDILIRDPAGWWLVENEDKRLAWFPAPYLDTCEEEDYDDYGELNLGGGGSLYCAMRNYSTKKKDEVSVTIGSVVEVLRKSDNGWWLIRCNGEAGYVPSMYLQPYNNPQAALHTLQTKLYNSTLNLTTNIPYGNAVNLAITAHSRAKVLPAQTGDTIRDSGLVSMTNTSTDCRQRSISSSTSTDSVFLPSSGNYSSRNSVWKEQLPASWFRMQKDPGHPPSFYNIQRPRVPPASWSSTQKPPYHPASWSNVSSRKGSCPVLSPSNRPAPPSRPKAQEILTRCTSRTRKAALSSLSQRLSTLDGEGWRWLEWKWECKN